MKCSYTNQVIKSNSYVRRFRNRFLGKDGYPKYLNFILKKDAERKKELDKIKDVEFQSLLSVCVKNMRLIFGMFRNDFDENLADALIQRKDDNGYFFERICIYLEKEDISDMMFDIRNMLSLEYDLISIIQNINKKDYSEYKQELKGQVNSELLGIFEKLIKFMENINILYDDYLETFADETFAIRDEILMLMDDYVKKINPASIMMILRKITSHCYEMLYFIDKIYEFEN
ncbi:MAG: hypothetical protein ACLFPQ_03515 [Candidatus Woesearchaeota archaeon]